MLYTANDPSLTKKTARQNAVEQKLPESYQNVANFNPYENMQYTQSFWDKVAGMFGFKTGKQKFEDEMHNNAQMYDAQLLQTAREEEYNSAENQVQRMREAGINPDLQSGAVSPGEASSFDNQASVAPETPDGNEAIERFVNFRNGRINQIGSMITGLLDVGMKVTSILNTGTSVMRNLLGIEKDNLFNNESLKSVVHDIISNDMFGEEDASNGMIYFEHDKNGHVVYKDGQPVMRGNRDVQDIMYNSFMERYPDFNSFWADESVRDRFFTKTMARRAYRMAEQELTNPEFIKEFYATLSDWAKNKKSYNAEVSSKYFNRDDGNMRDQMKGIVQAQDELVELALGLQKDNILTQKDINTSKRGQAQYTSEYYENMKGNTRGYRDPATGQWIKVESPSGAELQAWHDKGKLTVENMSQEIDKSVEKIFKKAIDYYIRQSELYPDDRAINYGIIMQLNSMRVRSSSPLQTVSDVLDAVNTTGDNVGGTLESTVGVNSREGYSTRHNDIL